MPAEGMPHEEESLLARPLGALTRLVMRHPARVLTAALILAAIAVALAVWGLGFRTNRLDLLNPNNAYNQRWLDYLQEFGNDDDAIVVVEGKSTEQVVAATDALYRALARQEDHFRAVMHQRDLTSLRSKGLHYLTLEELKRLDLFLQSIDPVLKGDWSQLNVLHSLRRMTQQPQQQPSTDLRQSPSDAAALASLIESLHVALDDAPRYQSPWPRMAELSDGLNRLEKSHLLTGRGRMGLILLKLRGGKYGTTNNDRAIEKLRGLIEKNQAAHTNVQIGLTGMPVLESDEMRSSKKDMLRASLLSLLGVACLFVAGFGGVRHPLATVASLLISMAWSLGYITLSVGHLNILSVSFGVILIGLGIDFGIHYVARYLMLLRDGQPCDAALERTASSVGPGIVTGGATTAIAFAAASMTQFTGVAELGIIAGGGILLCVAGAIIVLPALVYLIDRHRDRQTTPAILSIDPVLRPALRFPRLLLMLGLSLTVVLAVGVGRLRYDHNLLNLQARNLQSVHWERKLTDQSDRSVWFALSMSDSPQQLLQRKEQFQKLDCVERTEEIVSLLPESNADKNVLIADMASRLTKLPAEVPQIPVESPQQFQQMLELLSRYTPPDSKHAGSLRRLRTLVEKLPATDYYRRLSEYQQQLAGEILATLQLLYETSDPRPPRVADLPAALRQRFVGKSEKHLLRVYARGSIWDMDRLEHFVREVESVDPRVTGHPVQTFYASRQMLRSYIHAALYALLAVLVVLMIDFRSLRHSLLALSPMLLGLLQMFGILGLLDIPLNPANLIVLPLILGIGIDDGVHVVHDYLRQRGPYRLGSSTATAVLITSLTTMVGFGMMMFAHHQGLRSLGQVLVIGVFCCLGTSLVILPAWLGWLSRFSDIQSEDNSLAEEIPEPGALDSAIPPTDREPSQAGPQSAFAADQLPETDDAVSDLGRNSRIGQFSVEEFLSNDAFTPGGFTGKLEDSQPDYDDQRP